MTIWQNLGFNNVGILAADDIHPNIWFTLKA